MCTLIFLTSDTRHSSWVNEVKLHEVSLAVLHWAPLVNEPMHCRWADGPRNKPPQGQVIKTFWPRSVSGQTRESLNTVDSDVHPSVAQHHVLSMTIVKPLDLPYLVMLVTENLSISWSAIVKAGINWLPILLRVCLIWFCNNVLPLLLPETTVSRPITLLVLQSNDQTLCNTHLTQSHHQALSLHVQQLCCYLKRHRWAFYLAMKLNQITPKSIKS